MNPLTFPCPKCGKRMGVGLQLAGQSVRCPHCREVVVAPSTAGTPQLSQPKPRESAESILADPEESDDSLFAAPAPRVLTLPPPDPQPAPPPKLPVPVVAPPPAVEDNPFAIAAPSEPVGPRRKPPEKKPINWKPIAQYALLGYAVLMTILAAWGWLRSPSPQSPPAARGAK